MKHHLLDTTSLAEPIDTTHPSTMNLLANIDPDLPSTSDTPNLLTNQFTSQDGSGNIDGNAIPTRSEPVHCPAFPFCVTLSITGLSAQMDSIHEDVSAQSVDATLVVPIN